MALRVVTDEAPSEPTEAEAQALIDEAWIAMRKLVVLLRTAERELDPDDDLDSSTKVVGVPRYVARACESWEGLLRRYATPAKKGAV